MSYSQTRIISSFGPLLCIHMNIYLVLNKLKKGFLESCDSLNLVCKLAILVTSATICMAMWSKWAPALGVTSLSQNTWLPTRRPAVQARTLRNISKSRTKMSMWGRNGRWTERWTEAQSVSKVVFMYVDLSRSLGLFVEYNGVSSRKTNSDTT